MAKNGNFQLLLLQVIQADQLADLYPSSRGFQCPGMAISDFYCYRSYRQINWHIIHQQRHLVANNGNYRLLLLKVIQAYQLADLRPQVEASSGQECQYQIAFVPGHIGRSTGRCTSPCIGIQWPGMAISDCYSYRSYRQINWQMYPHPMQRHLMANNDNFRLLLLQVIQADQLADIPPPQVEACSCQEWQYQTTIVTSHIGRSSGRCTTLVEASNAQEWQFQISIVTGHIGRSTGRSTLLQQRHLMVKNVNFRWLLLQVIQAD